MCINRKHPVVTPFAMRDLLIRKFVDDDWPQLWPMLSETFSTGETYAYAPETSEDECWNIWIDSPLVTYVAVQDDKIVGTYCLKPNQPGLGSHVCNCGYIVLHDNQGQGVGTQLCRHSQLVAVETGFSAMQFNLVVATNTAATALWHKLGFTTIGILPKAYNSRRYGLVDAHVMYKLLH